VTLLFLVMVVVMTVIVVMFVMVVVALLTVFLFMIGLLLELMAVPGVFVLKLMFESMFVLVFVLVDMFIVHNATTFVTAKVHTPCCNLVANRILAHYAGRQVSDSQHNTYNPRRFWSRGFSTKYCVSSVYRPVVARMRVLTQLVSKLLISSEIQEILGSKSAEDFP
jgi:hypothetical protein